VNVSVAGLLLLALCVERKYVMSMHVRKSTHTHTIHKYTTCPYTHGHARIYSRKCMLKNAHAHMNWALVPTMPVAALRARRHR